MATKTSRLSLVIAGENKGAVKAVTGTEKALGGLKGKLGGLGAGLAGAFSAAAIVSFGKASVSAYDAYAGSVAKIKRLTGETAEGASLLAFAAQQTGVNADKAALSWQTLARNIENGKVSAAGIATQDGNGNARAFDDILGDVADKLEQLPAGYERTAFAQKLFGKSGAEVVKILKDGKDGIEAHRAEMEKYGLEFSDDGLKKYGEFKEAQRDMSAALLGVQVAVAENVIPAMSDFFDTMADGYDKIEPVTDAIGSLFAQTPDGVKAAIPVLIATGIAMKVIGGAAGLAALPVQALGAAHGWLAAQMGLATGAAGAVAAAELTEAETAAAAAVAHEALVASWVAGTPAAAGAAAATEGVAAANAQAAASSGAAAGGMGKAGQAGLLAAAGLGAFAVTSKGLDSLVDNKTDADALAEALRHVGASGQDLSDITEALGTDTEGLANAFKHSFDSAGYWERFTPAGDSAPKIHENQQQIKDLDAALAALVKNGHPEEARKAYGELTAELIAQGVPTEKVAQYMTDYWAAVDGAAKADENAKEEKSLLNDETDREASLLAQANTLVEHLNKTKLGKVEAQFAVADADQKRLDALDELNTAEQEAIGNSDEYRDARQAIADAETAVGEAQETVTEKLGDLRDAQADLNTTRAEAVVRLREQAAAERQAQLDAADAALKVKEAANEQGRVNADPRSTALEKERAALEVKKAEEAARKAGDDARQATIDNAAAQRAGVEGDSEVVAAHDRVTSASKAVADAEKAVGDARGQVATATKKAAKIITDAQGKVRDAERKVGEAVMDEAKAYGDLGTATSGALGGTQAYRDALAALSEDLKESNPLRTRIAALQQVLGLIGEKGEIKAGQTSTSPQNAPSGGRQTKEERKNRPGGDSLPGEPRPGGDAPQVVNNVTVNNINQGTPTQQRRASEDATTRSLNALVRSAR